MANPIGWCDKTWNPITGCSPVSEGCQNCYAERMAKRLKGRFGYPADDPFRVTIHDDRLHTPRHWQKPRRIFVCSMGDLFHKDVPRDFIVHIYSTMLDWRSHTYLILTKRPERMRKFNEDFGALLLESPHIQFGVTVENQERANERIPILLNTPAAVRFVSVEPMLGPVGLSPWLGPYACDMCGHVGAGIGVERCHSCELIINSDDGCTTWGGKGADVLCPECGSDRFGFVKTSYDDHTILDWVICGPETGPGARPMNPDWARSLRDQCQAAGVPFYFKGGELDGKTWSQIPEVKHG